MAVASCVPGYEEGRYFVSEGDPGALVKQMVEYLEEISDAAYAILLQRFQPVFEALQASPHIRCEKLAEELDSCLRDISVLVFNSQKYDLPLIQV